MGQKKIVVSFAWVLGNIKVGNVLFVTARARQFVVDVKVEALKNVAYVKELVLLKGDALSALEKDTLNVTNVMIMDIFIESVATVQVKVL